MIEEALQKLAQGQDLKQKMMEEVIKEIAEGRVTPEQIAALLMGLRTKGETKEELAGCILGLQSQALRVDELLRAEKIHSRPLVDTCGTGGDQLNTFNFSTTAALVVAGAGYMVAKHGNRAVSSKCGSADLLQELEVNIELEPAQVVRCIKEAGIGFFFAPKFHPAMAQVAAVRKKLGVRTIFNLAGPLSNPAPVTHQLVGVASRDLLELVAGGLQMIGTRHALVVHGEDGMDEVSLTGPTELLEVFPSQESPVYQKIIPEDYPALKRVALEELLGGDASANAKICLAILDGEKSPYRDAVLLNAGCALYVAGHSKFIPVESIQHGIEMAQESIDKGKAREKLKLLRRISQEP